MRILGLAIATFTIAISACKRTSNGDVVIDRPSAVQTTPDTIHLPSIGTRTDTITTPTVGTQTETLIVKKPVVAKKQTIVKTPVIKR